MKIPKAKYINGSKYPNAKMTISTDMNPYAGPNVNKTSILSTASVDVEGPKVVDNLGSGPKGQRSKVQIKKVPFKGIF
jgi:hypothetical protein